MLKEDIKKVKDQGKLFERLSSDYDTGKFDWILFICLIDFGSFFLALQKNADASKTKRMLKEPWRKVISICKPWLNIELFRYMRFA